MASAIRRAGALAVPAWRSFSDSIFMQETNDSSQVSFLTALGHAPMAADGAMGTELYSRGVLFNVCYDELNLSKPELVRQVHQDYVDAGARVLRTNTFAANAIRLARHGLAGRVREINREGVLLARSAAGPSCYVAGSIGPCRSGPGEEDIDDTETFRVFVEQAETLVKEGVDLVALETFRNAQELSIATAAIRSVVGESIPILAQVSVDENNGLADGSGVLDAARAARDHGATLFGVNCSLGPQQVLSVIESLISLGLSLSAIPNAGLPRRVDGRLLYVATPEYFGVYARRLLQTGVRIVGGCCGTTPEHIRRIASAVRMLGGRVLESDHVSAAEISLGGAKAGEGDPPPCRERTRLASLLGARFVVSVEVNPPLGVELGSAIEAARHLTEGGVDVINIADGPRAQARASNLALATRIQDEVGIETLLHVCGRDRNLLGQVAHLIGAHALGIRNVLAITGDPPKMGTYPDATAVYDLDSVGILRLIRRMNRGIDPGGKPLGGYTSFFAATGAEPAALNYEREIARLEEKQKAGAELILTQPVYDVGIIERFLCDVQRLGIPVLVGLLPLASYRNAEFLHNEVPGMRVPEEIRQRMKSAGTGARARREGVAIAREMLQAIRNRVSGVYVMPPLGRWETALEVIEGFV
jgi:methionine synthase / methylenetetrahydrofolate reductase(NADPH)